MKISISNNNENTAFILTPIDFSFAQIRAISIHVKSINNGSYRNGIVEIPFANSDANQTYSKIKISTIQQLLRVCLFLKKMEL